MIYYDPIAGDTTLKKAQVFLFYNVVSQYDSILENLNFLFPQIQKIKFEKCESI